LERSIKLTIQFNDEDKTLLLAVARDCILSEYDKSKKRINFAEIPLHLQEYGATFVTLTKHGQLRGCIGALSAYQPLVQDVCEHAKAAAFHDYRFSPVRKSEMADIVVEVSYLTDPLPLAYSDAEELKQKLRPGVDGVILSEGHYRATFLPQVWEQLPGVEEFLTHLCNKMGVHGERWKAGTLTVETYQAVHFSESDFVDLT
jgi:AmmeMemoRadiSam system protein A